MYWFPLTCLCLGLPVKWDLTGQMSLWIKSAMKMGWSSVTVFCPIANMLGVHGVVWNMSETEGCTFNMYSWWALFNCKKLNE